MAESAGVFAIFVRLLCFAVLVEATTRTYNFNVSWVRANPDGACERSVVGINGEWPIPRIIATKGDRLVVNVNNQLGNESTSLHFHGLFMNGSNYNDGVPGLTQCEIPPGKSMTYNFTLDQVGTYWYHSHVSGQYPDGLRAPLIIHDPDSPYADEYDQELIVTLSDWYHDPMKKLMKQFMSVTNPTGAEPVPKSALMNDTHNLKIGVDTGKTYFIRLINMGAFAGQYFWFENHSFTIIEVDGVWTEPATASMIYLTAAQRVGLLLKTKNDSSSNFPIVASMDEDYFDSIPSGLNPNVTGWLVYNESETLPDPKTVDEFSPYDDFDLVPYDRQEIFDSVDRSITLDVKMDNLGDGLNYAFFNDITYVGPKVPSLYTALSAGDLAANPQVYGSNTNSFVLTKDETVEIVLNNLDSGKHPFHLHGHEFQVVARSAADAGTYIQNDTMPAVPMRRDTFMTYGEWHMDSGLAITLVEAPIELQSTLTIPDSHIQLCKDSDTPYRGNAAANTVDYLDLTGENVQPDPLPAGFTWRGIVALAMSAVAAVLGMIAIAWYGAGELRPEELAEAQREIDLLREHSQYQNDGGGHGGTGR